MTMTEQKIALASLSRHLYRKGWMEGTGGNLSIRREGHILITPSGAHKGRIRGGDILELDGEGRPSETERRRPSAETAIHRVLYKLFPQAGAVIHVHTPDAILASLCGTNHLDLPPLEVLKGLGCPLPEEAPPIPIFENDPSVDRIAERIESRLRDTPSPLPALLIRYHGTTVWGETLDDALRHIELVEFCFRVMREPPHFPSSAPDS
ncbi:MAG: methylthioribulose 1-phosphate dehydratase [Leptospirillia bacterium]